MSSFTSPLVVAPLGDGRHWRLDRPFTYRIGSRYSRRLIRVAKNFLSDFASIPKFIFWLLPWWAKFNKSSILHDWLYKVKQIMGKIITRQEADDIWYEAMGIEFRHHKSGRFVAFIEYWGVRLFGFLSWHKDKIYLIKNSKPQRGQT